MAYDFYLDKCLLPVAPSKVQTKINGGNKTLSLINEGQINILKTAKLTDIEFECEIPQARYPFAVYRGGFKNAKYFLDYFERLKTQKKPFQFIVSRITPTGKILFSTNIKVSLEDYTITESADDGFDIKVKIKLKQYREYGTKAAVIKLNGPQSTASAVKKRAESTTQSGKTICIGSEVIVNGRLHASSYGDGPGQTRTNYRGKVNFINLKGSHPYHVTTPNGGWLGWVTKDSVKAV